MSGAKRKWLIIAIAIFVAIALAGAFAVLFLGRTKGDPVIASYRKLVQADDIVHIRATVRGNALEKIVYGRVSSGTQLNREIEEWLRLPESMRRTEVQKRGGVKQTSLFRDGVLTEAKRINARASKTVETTRPETKREIEKTRQSEVLGDLTEDRVIDSLERVGKITLPDGRRAVRYATKLSYPYRGAPADVLSEGLKRRLDMTTEKQMLDLDPETGVPRRIVTRLAAGARHAEEVATINGFEILPAGLSERIFSIAAFPAQDRKTADEQVNGIDRTTARSKLRGFTYFTPYWLGRKVDDAPLIQVQRRGPSKRSSPSAYFSYGQLHQRVLEVNEWPFNSEDGRYYWTSTYQVRKANVGPYPAKLQLRGTLMVHVGDTLVVIDGPSGNKLIDLVERNLQRLPPAK